MKNKLIAVAFMLLMNHILFSQNFVGNGEFENGNNCGNNTNTTTSPVCSSINNSCSNDYNCGQNYLFKEHFDQCPGGAATVNIKLQNWTDASSFINQGDCQFCFPHGSEWIYENFYDPVDIAGFSVTCPYGNGCVGSNLYSMIQQNMTTPIIRNGTYVMSMFIKQVNIGTYPDHNIHFIFSGAQPSYLNNSCQSNFNSLPSDYATITGTGVSYQTGYGSDGYPTPSGDLDVRLRPDQSYALDWTFLKQVFIPNDYPNYTWFTIATDRNATVGGAVSPDYDNSYFAFDNVYIDQAGCYCPPVEVVQNQILESGNVIRAQDYIIIGNNVSISSGGSTPVIFRAGQSITINAGFQATYGSLFVTQKGGCYDGQGAISGLVATGITPCESINNEFFFASENATSYELIWADRWGDIWTYSGDVFNIQPFAQTLVKVDYASNDVADTYVYNLKLYGCDGAFWQQSGNVTVLGTGCGSGKTSPPLGRLNDTISVGNNDFKVYPNPSCNNIRVIISNFAFTDLIQILDLTGQVIRQLNPTSSDQSYDISDLSDGVYTVKYISTNNSQTKKIVKVCK